MGGAALQRLGLHHGGAAASVESACCGAQVTLLCKLGMTKVELRRLAVGHARFFSFTARATRPKLLLLRTQACSPVSLKTMILVRLPNTPERHGVS